MHLLITRPLIQASRTAEKLDKLGYEYTIEPLLLVEEVNTQIPKGSFDAIIITSATALSALDQYWPIQDRTEIPVVTTGEVTKSEIEKLGFANCQSVNGSANDIIAKFSILAPDSKKILYPCAEEVSVNLVQGLKLTNITCVPWIVYKMNKIQNMTPSTINRLNTGQIDGILLYSSKTAQIFSHLWMKNLCKLSIPHIFALSENIQSKLPPKLAQRCSYPANPNENDLFKLLSKSTINNSK